MDDQREPQLHATQDDMLACTIVEAARLLRTSPLTIRRWMRSGMLRAERRGRHWTVFVPADLLDFARPNLLKYVEHQELAAFEVQRRSLAEKAREVSLGVGEPHRRARAVVVPRRFSLVLAVPAVLVVAGIMLTVLNLSSGDDQLAEPALPAASATPSVELAAEEGDARPVSPSSASAGAVEAPAVPTSVAVEQIAAEAFGGVPVWPERRGPTSSVEIQGGVYHIELFGQRNLSVSLPLASDLYRAGVDVEIREGAAGIVFAAAKPAIFYRIVLSADGTYAVQRLDENGSGLTNVVEWTRTSEGAAQPAAPLRLVVERRGDSVVVWVDDRRLTEYRLPPAEELVGQYGLVVTASDGRASAVFDNFVVERLAP